jgi:pilus assembly protein CpaF
MTPETLTGQDERLRDLVWRLGERVRRDLDREAAGRLPPEVLRQAVTAAARALLIDEAPGLDGPTRETVVRAVVDDLLGLGPLEPLMQDPTVTEIMVNGPRQVYVERGGRLHPVPVTFRDAGHLLRIIERIIAPLGRRLDEASPMVDARLPDGSRVNAVIPPLAVDGPYLTIRKFAREVATAEDLLRRGTLTPEALAFLAACVRARVNIVVSGGTGTGKTTLLNVLSSFIPPDERIVTIEDPCELQLHQPHVVRLETRPPNSEGQGEITQRHLVKNALRMRPDRIIVGEARGAEAFDMLQAMNTGHEGSMTTVHANSPRDALARLENMVLMAGFDLPVRAVREQVASAVHLIVHLARESSGRRRVTHLTAVEGMEGDRITTQDVFLLQEGELRPTGVRPHRLAQAMERVGVEADAALFTPPAPDGGGRWW